MKKSASLCNSHRPLFALSVALACAALGGATMVRADSGTIVTAQATPAAPAGPASHGTVKGERSNVRSRPSLHSEVIAQLHKGESVDVLERKAVTEHDKTMDWLRISLPEKAKCYVNAKHVMDGTVDVDELNVRCGPGSSFRDVGKLAKGTRVETVQKKGEWLQIRPTPDCSGWIAAELVDVEVAPAPVATPPPTPTANSGQIVTPPVAAPMPPSVSIVNTDPDVLVTYAVKDGYLDSVTESNAPAPYELRTPEEDRLSSRIAYVEAPGLDLKKYDGKHVRLMGTQRWHKGDRYPVITIERVDRVW
ncbi:MAG TPA: SH3 domain-containing protein [Verrucomicrobiae bacterium]|nr:SH3 domain-containing protein [Verrucomicrobiae bacterium]